MKKISLLLISAFISFCLNAQTTDWKKVQDELKTTVRNPEFVKKILDSKKLIGMSRRVIQEHYTEIYKSDEALDYLVNEIRSAGLEKSSSKNAFEEGRKFGSELFLALAIKGMSRLSPLEQRRFISYIGQWMNFASPEDCKFLLISGSSATALESADIEMKYYNKFKEEELRNYFYTLRLAMLAELKNYPYARVLNQNQIKIADDALQIELEKKIKNKNIPTSVLLAFQDMNTSSAKDTCEAGKIVVNSILDLKGFAGDLVVSKYILSIQ